MDTLGLIDKTALAIFENDQSNTFASAVSKHAPVDWEFLVDEIKGGGSLVESKGYESSIAVVGLFIVHQESFMTCLNQISESHQKLPSQYLANMMTDHEHHIISALSVFEGYASFETYSEQQQLVCYKVIHMIVVHIVELILKQYDLQKSFNTHIKMEQEITYLLGLN